MEEPRRSPGAEDGAAEGRRLRRARRLAAWVAALIAGAVVLTFLLGAIRHAFLCDDAFISFRYARHLVDGLGLAWNPGERVEGYTDFLWVLLVAAGMRLGWSPQLVAATLGVASGLGVLALLAWLGARDHGWRDPLIWLAPATLALNGSFLAWSTGGLETQFFSLLTLGALVAFLGERRREFRRPWRSPLLFALATLTRPEGSLFAAVAGGALLLDRRRRRESLRPAVAWAGLYAVPVALHFAWRLSYYGDWLPNTFRAKVDGFRWLDGLHYLAYFATSYQLDLLLLLAVLAVAVRRDFREGLFAAVVGVDLLYLAAIGGDFLEFRFLVPLFPYLYWLMAEGVRVLAEWARPGERRRWAAVVAPLAAVALLGGTAFSPRSRWIQPPFGFENVAGIRRYAVLRVGQGLDLAGLVARGLLPADLRIDTGGLGALSYYTDWFVIDHHGLTDRYVAELPATYRRLAHGHLVTAGYLKRRRVAAALLSQVMILRDRSEFDAAFASWPTWLRSLNQTAEKPDEVLRPVCLEVEPEAFLIFATNLDPASFQQLFGRFPSCPMPLSRDMKKSGTGGRLSAAPPDPAGAEPPG